MGTQKKAHGRFSRSDVESARNEASPRFDITGRMTATMPMAQDVLVPDRGEVGAPGISLVVFVLDGVRYAVHLDHVERVLPMVAATPLPGAPEIALGAMNLHGDPIPILDIRRRFGFPPREYGLSTRLLVATTNRRRLAFPVDDVLGVEELHETVSPPEKLLPGLRHIAGVVAVGDGLLFIHDLESFLSLGEETMLDGALERLEAAHGSEP